MRAIAVAAALAWAVAAAACTATPARADPCTAIPDRGPAPAWIVHGAQFAGTVRHVGDGDSICVSSSPDPRTWVEVRLADFYAPELSEPGGRAAASRMRALAAGRTAACEVTREGRVRSYDRVVATCRIGGRSLGDLMRAAGVGEGGRGLATRP